MLSDNTENNTEKRIDPNNFGILNQIILYPDPTENRLVCYKSASSEQVKEGIQSFIENFMAERTTVHFGDYFMSYNPIKAELNFLPIVGGIHNGENVMIINFSVYVEDASFYQKIETGMMKLMKTADSSLRRSQFLGPYLKDDSYRPSGFQGTEKNNSPSVHFKYCNNVRCAQTVVDEKPLCNDCTKQNIVTMHAK